MTKYLTRRPFGKPGWAPTVNHNLRVFRVQDANGRGPFRPGFSVKWCDDDFHPSMSPLPTWMEEFGWDLIDRLDWPTEHFGCAVRSVEQISRWFSDAEQYRLALLGFNLVSLDIARILAESPNQLVFARQKPLANDALIVPWLFTRTPPPPSAMPAGTDEG